MSAKLCAGLSLLCILVVAWAISSGYRQVSCDKGRGEEAGNAAVQVGQPRATNVRSAAGSGLRLSLTSTDEVVEVGTVPQFVVTVTNTTDTPARILDLRGNRRPDLQDTYLSTEVYRVSDGQRVEVLTAISDPGPISESDFMILEPGERVSITLSRFAPALDTLPPGEYAARVRFWQDPHEGAETRILSPPAVFTVK